MNRLLYAGAWVVKEKLGMIGGKVGDGKRKEKKKPHWQQRIEKSIGEWRKDLAWVEQLKRSGKFNDETMGKLDKKYNLLEKGCLSVSTFLKNKIRTISNKIKNKVQQQRHNQLFKNNQFQLYKELSGSINQGNPPSNAVEAVTFCENIWSREKEHNREASWLNEARRTMGVCGQQEDVVVTEEDVVDRVKRSSNWKAAGPDGVRAFRFKIFT